MHAKYFDFRFYQFVFESWALKRKLLSQTKLLHKTKNNIENASSNSILTQKHNLLVHYHAIIKQAERNISRYNSYLRNALDSDFHTYCQLGNQFTHFATMLQNVQQLKMEYNGILRLYNMEVKLVVQQQRELARNHVTLRKHVQYINTKMQDRLDKIARYNKQV